MNNKYIIYNDFSAALKDSKNKDLNFSIEDLKEFETKNKVNDKEKIEEEKKENNNNNNINNNKRNIRILEMDELFTYVKKNQKIKKEKLILIKEYGLLLIGIKEN